MPVRVQAHSHGTNKRRQRLSTEERLLKLYVLWQAYLLIAVTGLGCLALTWSTVVLLGGFVSTLGKKDFWCLTAISMIQAARIFSDADDLMMLDFFNLSMMLMYNDISNRYRFISELVRVICTLLLIPVVQALMVIYTFGSVICFGLSLWRLVQRDYGNIDRDGTLAKLMPALDIFYSLALCQCALFFIRFGNDFRAQPIVASLCRVCKFPETWATVTIGDYLMDTLAKCMQSPASIKGTNLVDYAVGLLGSESSQDYPSGARMVDMFIKQGVDIRSLLLPSRPKIQKLIDTLRWRSSDREIRELAARILAYLARDIDLTQFPGAIRCISSLLDTTLPYWNNQQEPSHQAPQWWLEQTRDKERHISQIKKLEQHGVKRRNNLETDGQQGEGGNSSINETEGNGWNELILQGLTILERLASDQHNCSDICGTPDLLPKIMAPLYSNTLIQDINVRAWADVVNGSLKVVHRLIRSPDWVGKNLGYEISSRKQALSNLVSILEQSNKAGKELQMTAMEILTELNFDPSTNLSPETKEILIRKQMQIFLADDDGEEENLKVMAGQTLSVLSKKGYLSDTGSVSVFITSKYSYIVDRLTEILDAKNKIRYRKIAAEILENLCTRHIMDKEHVKNTLLPKVLTEVLTTKGEPLPEPSGYHRIIRPNYEKRLTSKRKRGLREVSQRKLSGPGEHEENHGDSLEGDDEEKNLSEHEGQIKSADQANEEQTAMMELQEAFLSLTLVICDKLIISEDDFDEVAPGEGEFVAKLKIIVEENCEATANSLRIVKLCGQIAVTMMGRKQYTTHFKEKKFVESLSEASRIMCNLESCMLFAGTDGGAKKTVRPLLSDLVKEVQATVA